MTFLAENLKNFAENLQKTLRKKDLFLGTSGTNFFSFAMIRARVKINIYLYVSLNKLLVVAVNSADPSLYLYVSLNKPCVFVVNSADPLLYLYVSFNKPLVVVVNSADPFLYFTAVW